jgi:activator of HSP90 ATPase
MPAAPLAVYRAIADAREHSAVTGARATGRARPGARFTAWDGYIRGRTLRADPGRRLVQEWSTSEWPTDTRPSRVEWRFQAHPRGTRVTLRHTGVPRSQVKSYRTGWIEYYWRPLGAYFAARG